MVVKAKRNEYGDCVYAEQDIIDLIYQNPDFDIGKLQIDPVEKYLKAVKDLGLEFPLPQQHKIKTEKLHEFDSKNTSSWYMPDQYQDLDIKQYLLEKCNSNEEIARVNSEYELFEKKGFLNVLKFLVYFIDTLRSNNIVWGVGRGSSVSSFCLFLIGVHKINPLLYDLDHTEFLR